MTSKNLLKIKLPNVESRQPPINALVWTQNILSVFMCGRQTFVPFSLSKLRFHIYPPWCGRCPNCGKEAKLRTGADSYKAELNIYRAVCSQPSRSLQNILPFTLHFFAQQWPGGKRGAFLSASIV